MSSRSRQKAISAPHLGDAPAPVLGHGAFEGIVAAAGVVEIGDGVGEPPARQIAEMELELAEGAGGLFGEAGFVDVVEGGGALDENVAAPVVAHGILMPDLAHCGRG